MPTTTHELMPLERLFIDDHHVTGCDLNLRFADYAAAVGMNSSALTRGFKSPLHFCHAAHAERGDSRDMRIGRAVHSLVLEPAQFDTEFAIWSGTRRGTEWKEFATEFADLEILTRSEADEAEAIAFGVQESPRAQELLAGTEREVSVFAPLFDLQFKGRLDAMSFTECRIVDLKTTSDLGSRGKSFGYRFHDFHYGPQLWIYRELLWVIAGELFSVDLIVVETKPPYDVVTIPIHESVLDNYGKRVERLVKTLVECRAYDCWPGVGGADESIELALPARGMFEDDEEVVW